MCSFSHFQNIVLYCTQPSCEDVRWQNTHIIRCICNLRYDSKTSTNFFFLLHNFMNRFVLTTNLSNLSMQFLLLSFEKFSLKGSTLQLLFGISELPALLLLQFVATIKWNNDYLHIALWYQDTWSDNSAG